MWRSFTLARLFAAAVALAVTAPPAVATPALRKELKGVALEVQKFLTKQGADSVALGQFTGPPSAASNAGPGIQQILREELEAAGVAVKLRAKHGLKGEYLFDMVEEPTTRAKLTALKLSVRLTDDAGKDIASLKFEANIHDEQTVAQTAGVTVELPSTPNQKAPNPVRDADIQKSRKADGPAVFLDGTKVLSSPKGTFAVEVLVKGTGRTPKIDENLAFIPLTRDEEFEVRLTNNLPHEAAVSLTLDGLSVFAFSEIKDPKNPKSPQFNHYVVGAGKTLTIPGWHKNEKQSFKFKITSLPESAATELSANPAGIGVITATFAACWEGGTPPADETANRQSLGRDAIGKGPVTPFETKAVERTVGSVRGVVSVRYTK